MDTLIIPAWVLALFEGEDHQDDKADDKGGDAQDRVADRSDRADRNDRGDRNDSRRNARFETESEERIYNALEKQRNQTKEAERQAKQAKAQLDELAPKAAMVDVMVQRAIRLEARDALRDAGVLHPDVVDLFLAKSPEVKIDAGTGEVVGISESLEKFKTSHAPLFKVADAKDVKNDKADDKADGKADDKADDKADKADKSDKQDGAHRRNATSTGRTPSGQSGTSGSNSGLPDLRGMTPAQRKAALTAYKQSLNVQ